MNISIKDVPESWAETLRRRATRNHRSLQGELMAILEQMVLAEAVSSPPPAVGRRRGTKTLEELTVEQRRLFPRPVVNGPLGTDIIQRIRDAR